MTPLCRRMAEDMQVRDRSPSTQDVHTRKASPFALFRQVTAPAAPETVADLFGRPRGGRSRRPF